MYNFVNVLRNIFMLCQSIFDMKYERYMFMNMSIDIEHGHICVYESDLSKWNVFNKESFWSGKCPLDTFCVLRMLVLTIYLVGTLCDLWSLYVWPFLLDWYMLYVSYVGRTLLVPKGKVSHHIRVVAYWCM